MGVEKVAGLRFAFVAGSWFALRFFSGFAIQRWFYL
jgi:hypothetical protein